MIDYTVVEEGSDTGFHTYPALGLCSAPAEWFPLANYYGSMNSCTTDASSCNAPGGYLQAYGGEPSNFFYDCYLPGDSAQFSITPADNPSVGWQWSNSWDGPPWSDDLADIEPGSSSTGNYPSLLFPGSSTILPATGHTVSGTNFLDSSTYGGVIFRQSDPLGDMQIVSLRTTNDSY